jgi:hypothetical protein
VKSEAVSEPTVDSSVEDGGGEFAFEDGGPATCVAACSDGTSYPVHGWKIVVKGHPEIQAILHQKTEADAELSGEPYAVGMWQVTETTTGHLVCRQLTAEEALTSLRRTLEARGVEVWLRAVDRARQVLDNGQ